MYWNKFAPIILACVQVNMIHIYNEGPIGLTYMPVFFFGKYLRNKISSQFNSWPLQTILSIFSLPLIPQNNVEATQEVSLPLQALPPSKTYHFLSGSSDDGGMKNLTSQDVSFPFLSSLALPENSQLSSLQPLLPLPPYKELSCLWRITYPFSGKQTENVQFTQHACSTWVTKCSQMSFDLYHQPVMDFILAIMKTKKMRFSLERWKQLTQFGKWQSRYRDPISGSKAHTFFSLFTYVWPEWLASRACSPIANVKHAGPQSTHLGNTQGSLTCWR